MSELEFLAQSVNFLSENSDNSAHYMFITAGIAFLGEIGILVALIYDTMKSSKYQNPTREKV